MSDLMRPSIMRFAVKFVVLIALLVAAFFGGEALGERQVHRKLAAAWNEFFSTEKNTGSIEEMQADPFSGNDPFSADPFAADPF